MENGNHNGNYKPPEPGLDSAPSSSLDFDQVWYIARDKAWLIILAGLLGILGALAYIHKTPLTYYAQAVIEVDPEPVKVIGYNEDVQETKDPISEDMAQTLKAVFQSREFAAQVIQNYDLLDFPNFVPRGPDGKLPDFWGAVGALIGMERVTLPPGTRFINVGVIHSDPVMAGKLADYLANHYCASALEEREARNNAETDYLQKQADAASEELKKSETALADYERDSKSLSLDPENDTVISELRSKDSDLIAGRAELTRLQADDEEAQIVKGNQDALLSIPSVANDPTVMQYKETIGDLQSKIEVMKLTYTEAHPKMISIRTQLADVEDNLTNYVLKIPELIHAKRQAAETRVANFNAAEQKQEGAALNLDYAKIRYDVLERRVETDKAHYEGVLSRLKDSKTATGMNSTQMHIFEPAQTPMEPMQARKSKMLMMGAVGGIIVGLIISFGLHMMDSSIKSVDQAEDLLGLTVLASIPRQNQSKLKESSLALVKAPGSPVAEAFRSLRTSIFLAGRAKGRKIVLFTSTLAGEGKTFCSTNYATSLAQQGLRTLLIDADLRSPMIRTVMLANRKVPGLGELLMRKINSEQAIHQCEVENLWIMPAGELLPNPAELLARSDMGEIVRHLQETFERIVIDTAPITAVSDTLLLLEHAEAICLVSHACRTPRKWIKRAIKLIAGAGSRPTGVILNQMPLRMAGAYSYYPGKYGEPEVYGSVNGSYGRIGDRPLDEEDLDVEQGEEQAGEPVDSEPRF